MSIHRIKVTLLQTICLLNDAFPPQIDGVANAVKYNKDSGTVTIDLAKEDGHIRLSVSDTGIGIPAEHQSRVFERFYRVDKSHSKLSGGTGLGLSIVKHAAATTVPGWSCAVSPAREPPFL